MLTIIHAGRRGEKVRTAAGSGERWGRVDSGAVLALKLSSEARSFDPERKERWVGDRKVRRHTTADAVE